MSTAKAPAAPSGRICEKNMWNIAKTDRGNAKLVSINNSTVIWILQTGFHSISNTTYNTVISSNEPSSEMLTSQSQKLE